MHCRVGRYLARVVARSAILAVAAVLVLSGCGGDSNDGQGGGIVGTVFNEQHAGLFGAELVAMERESNAKYTAITDAKGVYTLFVSAGTYDLGVSAKGYVTFFAGPITVSGEAATPRDVSLASAAGVSLSRMFGKITTANGAPAAGWKVKCSSNVDARSGGEIVEVAADGNGNFEADLGTSNAAHFKQEYLLDLDFSRPDGTSVEFVDIHKRGGPVQVELVLDGAAKNKYRHNESPRNGPAVAASTSLVAPQANAAIQTSKSALQTPFAPVALLYGGAELLEGKGVIYVCKGRAEVNSATPGTFAGTLHWTDEFPLKGDTPDVSTHVMEIDVSDNGSWWYTYRISAQITTSTTNLELVDESGDSYTLDPGPVQQTSWHSICYNSSAPTVVWAYIDNTDQVPGWLSF